MWIRKIFRRGDSVMVTIPRDVRRAGAWVMAGYVEIEYQPPLLLIRPMRADELMHHTRSEEEGLPDRGDPDA